MLAVLVGLRKDDAGTNASAVIHDVAAISISAEAKICDDWYILYVYIDIVAYNYVTILEDGASIQLAAIEEEIMQFDVIEEKQVSHQCHL